MQFSQAEVLHSVLQRRDAKRETFRLVRKGFQESVLYGGTISHRPCRFNHTLTKFSCLYSRMMNVSMLLAVTLAMLVNNRCL
jgi:hypothetical protein